MTPIKRHDCTFYGSCLNVAVRRGWLQFHCSDCKAFEKRFIDDRERILARKPE